MKITKEFYQRSALEVAPDLLGLNLVHNTKDGITKGKIVEVEAYMGTIDAAAHSYKGTPSKRTQIQYKEGGYAYIYLIYGMYYCMNIVTNGINIPEVVLLRALEPVEGVQLMKKRRNIEKLEQLCNGPGKLCTAMGINKMNYGMDLLGEQLYLEAPKESESFPIETSKRINIDYAKETKDYLWRYTIADSRFLSVKKKRK